MRAARALLRLCFISYSLQGKAILETALPYQADLLKKFQGLLCSAVIAFVTRIRDKNSSL
jgi:hypothetical protein